jgi:hypothetical protein
MIEFCVQYKIFPDGIRDCPQIADRIPVCEWLSEMPEFALA